ncbi:MAG: tetratricopeptide repeat protein [Flavobacteriaceae bacterium]|nr:tetratricopeptide repeat protein [Flavobacteriaceae bacterium]
MEFSPFDDNQNLSLSKFESMLKTNDVLFFDSNEFENIIHHYLDIGKISLAKKAIKLGLTQHPTSINLKLFKVELYVYENKFDDASQLLEELYALEPTNEEIYIQKANIFSKTDDHKKAIELFEQALIYAQDPSDIYSLIGMEYLFLDLYEEAKLNFMLCLENDYQDYSALYNVMYCFEYLEQYNEAINYLTSYLDKNPYCEVAWHQLGKQYVTIKAYEKALTAFDFAIYSDDTFIGAYLEKGQVLEQLNRCSEAIENYKITLAIDDPTSFALLRIGSCYEKLNDDELAVQHYYKTVKEDPLLDKGWIAITNYYFKKKKYVKALHYINKAINIDSQNVVYWKLYSQINHRLNLLAEAERGYKKTLELGNYEIETWIARTDILIKIGEFNEALSTLNQASEFYPDNEEIEFRLSGLYFLLNKAEDGYIHLSNALHANPEHIFIMEELFPKVYVRNSVQKIIANFKKTSK